MEEYQRLMGICQGLRVWFRRNRYRGHDPYLLEGLLGRRRNLYYKYFPFPKMLFSFIRKRFIWKALGLLVRGNTSLYQVMKSSELIEENTAVLSILMQNRFQGFQFPAWGWPFRWRSGSIVFPRDFPIAVVTAEIAGAFADQYELTGKSEFLKVCTDIAKHLVYENGYADFGNSICFYYGSYDRYLVHNTNLYTAAYLARVSRLANSNYRDLIWKSVKFSLEHQNKDGSWYYWAPPFVDANRTIDNRHTGYVLVALKWVNDFLESDYVNEAIRRGYAYWRSHMIRGSVPKASARSVYPIDMHDIAQGIITAAELSDVELGKQMAAWAIDRMSNGKDEFYYRQYEDGRLCRMPFFRWTQAWMYRALSLLCSALIGEK